MAPYGNVVLLRDYSPGVLKQFPDGFFEYAYVDACHDYGSVLADLLALWPKLAKGAILAGHDYQVRHGVRVFVRCRVLFNLSNTCGVCRTISCETQGSQTTTYKWMVPDTQKHER